MESGLPKLFVTHTALQLRREHPEWFGADAAYSPILAEGAKHDHLVGFSRANCVAAFVPRWTIKLASGWASTNVNLPPGQWLNLFTQEVVAGGQMLVQRLLRDFPVALLIRQED
jgi:(1->4)-alpha-D-glucan 1-alpha-D-glucosylmutase